MFDDVLLIYSIHRLNYRITNIFREEGIPVLVTQKCTPSEELSLTTTTRNGHARGAVRVTHKSYTLRRALFHNNNKERTCTRANCPISSTKLCLLLNAVYQITCNNCNQYYIGSTTRFIHERVKEHLNNDNSSVRKQISKCQNKVYKGIIIVLENDPANLRLFEAFYIRNYKPAINSREDCREFADLLF